MALVPRQPGRARVRSGRRVLPCDGFSLPFVCRLAGTCYRGMGGLGLPSDDPGPPVARLFVVFFYPLGEVLRF